MEPSKIKELSELCDREGISPQHLVRFPDLLSELGVDPYQVTSIIVQQVRDYDMLQLQKVMDWYESLPDKEREALPVRPRIRPTIYGNSVMQIVAELVRLGYSNAEIRRCIVSYGLRVAEHSIRSKRANGVVNPAILTPDQRRDVLFRANNYD